MVTTLAKALLGSLVLGLIACSTGNEPPDDVPSSPGTQIVFQASDSTSSDIYVVNADGSGLTRLTGDPEFDAAPTWSADGRQIYFLSSNRDGHATRDLYAMNPDGTGVHLLAESISSPYAVSPDGTRIVVGGLHGAPYQNVDLFIMNVGGSERTLILDLPCEYPDSGCEELNALDWSPDGQRIAYSARWPGHGGSRYGLIGIVNPDGSGHRVLDTSAERSTDPAWSPDGQRIVFGSGSSSTIPNPAGLDLTIINADGTGRIVVLGGAEIGSPSWSPNRQSIVFAQFQDNVWDPAPGHSEVYVVNTDGTGLRQVADAPGNEYAPDWNPAGP